MYPVELSGYEIHLRELQPTDVDAIHRIVGDPVVCETLIFPPKTRSETLEYVMRFVDAARIDARTEYYLAVLHPDASSGTDDLVGTARIGLGDFASGNIGYAIRRDRWGQGLATAATRLLVDFGFGQLGLHRIWASHGPDNPPSGQVLRNAGMTYEGTLRENVLDKGRWRDSLVYAVLAQEWPGGRSGPAG